MLDPHQQPVVVLRLQRDERVEVEVRAPGGRSHELGEGRLDQRRGQRHRRLRLPGGVQDRHDRIEVGRVRSDAECDLDPAQSRACRHAEALDQVEGPRVRRDDGGHHALDDLEFLQIGVASAHGVRQHGVGSGKRAARAAARRELQRRRNLGRAVAVEAQRLAGEVVPPVDRDRRARRLRHMGEAPGHHRRNEVGAQQVVRES